MTITETPTHVHLFPPHGKVIAEREEYIVELDVSEFAHAELKVRVDGHLVTVTGTQNADEAEGETLALCERLEESFHIPADARSDDLYLEFDDGKCEIHMPRHRFGVNPDAAPC